MAKTKKNLIYYVIEGMLSELALALPTEEGKRFESTMKEIEEKEFDRVQAFLLIGIAALQEASYGSQEDRNKLIRAADFFGDIMGWRVRLLDLPLERLEALIEDGGLL